MVTLTGLPRFAPADVDGRLKTAGLAFLAMVRIVEQLLAPPPVGPLSGDAMNQSQGADEETARVHVPL